MNPIRKLNSSRVPSTQYHSPAFPATSSSSTTALASAPASPAPQSDSVSVRVAQLAKQLPHFTSADHVPSPAADSAVITTPPSAAALQAAAQYASSSVIHHKRPSVSLAAPSGSQSESSYLTPAALIASQSAPSSGQPSPNTNNAYAATYSTTPPAYSNASNLMGVGNQSMGDDELVAVLDPKDPAIMMSGYLALKKGIALRSWKPRFFVLTSYPPALNSFEVSAGAPAGDLPISAQTECKIEYEGSGPFKYKFTVTSPAMMIDDVWKLHAPTIEEREEWMTKINQLIEKLKSASTGDQPKGFFDRHISTLLEKIPDKVLERLPDFPKFVQPVQDSDLKEEKRSGQVDFYMQGVPWEELGSYDVPLSPRTLLRKYEASLRDRSLNLLNWKLMRLHEGAAIHQWLDLEESSQQPVPFPNLFNFVKDVVLDHKASYPPRVLHTELFKISMVIDSISCSELFRMIHDIKIRKFWDSNILDGVVSTKYSENVDIVSKFLRDGTTEKILRHWVVDLQEQVFELAFANLHDNIRERGDIKVRKSGGGFVFTEGFKKRFSDPPCVCIAYLLEVEVVDTRGTLRDFLSPWYYWQNSEVMVREKIQSIVLSTIEELAGLQHYAKLLHHRILDMRKLMTLVYPPAVESKQAFENEKEVLELVDVLEAKNVQVPDHDLLSRLLRGNGNIANEEVVEKVRLYWELSRLYDIDNLKPEMFIEEMRSGLCVVSRKPDQKGRPIVYIDASKHMSKHPTRTDAEHLMIMTQYATLMLDYAQDLIPDDQSKFNLVIDVKNLSFKNMDTALADKLSKLLDVRCCERTNVIIVINAGLLFRSVWEALQHFIPPDTAKKLQVLSGPPKSREILTKFIDARNLPTIYGGDDPEFTYFFSEQVFIKQWNETRKLKEAKRLSRSRRGSTDSNTSDQKG
jgi:hypothetical protein